MSETKQDMPNQLLTVSPEPGAVEEAAAETVDLEAALQTDPVVAEVLAGFDLQNPIQRRAASDWLKTRQAELTIESWGTVLHRFQSAAIKQRAIAFFIKDVEENVALLQAQLARQCRAEAEAHLHAGLATLELFFAEEGDLVLAHRQEVRRVTKSQQLDGMRRILKFSQELADGAAALSPEQLMNGQMPESLRDMPIREFTSDLGEFVVKNGAEGREAIRRLCLETETAAAIVDDPQVPRVLRQLAEWSGKVQVAQTLKLDRPERAVGFKAD